MKLIVGFRLALLLSGFEPIEQIGRVNYLCFISLLANGLTDYRETFLVRELLIIELTRPHYPNLFTLPGKQCHKTKSGRLGDHPIRQLHGSPHQYPHPHQRADQKHRNAGNQINLSIARSVKPAHVRHQTAGVQYRSNG